MSQDVGTSKRRRSNRIFERINKKEDEDIIIVSNTSSNSDSSISSNSGQSEMSENNKKPKQKRNNLKEKSCKKSNNDDDGGDDMKERLKIMNEFCRRSSRFNPTEKIESLADEIVSKEAKSILFITGAGISVNSGIKPFRGPDGVWSHTIQKRLQRDHYQKLYSKEEKLKWYNQFWFRHFPPVIISDGNIEEGIKSEENWFFAPNAAHEALAELTEISPNIKIITQNIDGLDSQTKTKWNHKEKLIEAHGRLGLYKCISDSDSDSDSDDDSDSSDDDSTSSCAEDDRKIDLGSRSKFDEALKCKDTCRYRLKDSISLRQIKAFRPLFPSEDNVLRRTKKKQKIKKHVKRKPSVIELLESSSSEEEDDDFHNAGKKREIIEISDSSSSSSSTSYDKCSSPSSSSSSSCSSSSSVSSTESTHSENNNYHSSNNCYYEISKLPKCPECNSHIIPQALMFDEGYDSHSFYNFQKMEDWINEAQVIVFVGTTFEVVLTQSIREYCRVNKIPVYNLNVEDRVQLGVMAYFHASNEEKKKKRKRNHNNSHIAHLSLNSTTILGDVGETIPMLLNLVKKKLK